METSKSNSIRSTIFIGIFAIGITILPSAPDASGQSKQIPGMSLGDFKVSSSGAATYNIPIIIPPGTNGMAPKLSLVYDSQKSNGLLGMGWAIDGLPTIQRCPRTKAQDNFVGGVNFDANDRFCLQGQRLIVVNNMADGANGAEYRTELDTFVRVFSYGTAGSGPAYFVVKNNAGETMEFGGNANDDQGRIEAQGKSSVRVWALSRIIDTKGNFLTVSYDEDNANGDYRPTSIAYTGNGQNLLRRSIIFSYESRTDQTSTFIGGSRVKIIKRLINIKTYAPSSIDSGLLLVRNYVLQY